jgi:nucleoside-diphosphate-sugar epimerase
VYFGDDGRKMSASVLVTGDTGFLGSRLVSELKKRGHTVRGLSRSSSDIKLDINQIESPRLLPKVDIVVHTAAIMNFTQQAENQRVNVIGTAKLLNAVVASCINRFVHVSTAFLFGNNPYEISKKMAEEQVEYTCGQSKTELTIIRPSIIVEDSNLKDKPPSNGVYTGLRILKQALEWYEQKTGVVVTGKEIRVKGNPQGKMNVIPVDFVARAIADAIEQIKTGVIYATHPNPPTLKFLENPLSRVLGVKIKFLEDFEPNRLERMVGMMTKDFMQYLQGYDFTSDIDCPAISEEFVAQSSLAEMEGKSH